MKNPACLFDKPLTSCIRFN